MVHTNRVAKRDPRHTTPSTKTKPVSVHIRGAARNPVLPTIAATANIGHSGRSGGLFFVLLVPRDHQALTPARVAQGIYSSDGRTKRC
jgi:hypothetical protein